MSQHQTLNKRRKTNDTKTEGSEMNQRGKFITLESGEGGGKTSVVSNLRKILGHDDFVYVNDPGSFTPELSHIRNILLSSEFNLSNDAELLLYAAARVQLVDSIISPALQSGKHVISDRFSDSTSVYQGYIRGYDRYKLDILNTEFAGNLIPDLTILLDVDAKVGLSRSLDRLEANDIDEGRWESMGLAVHERINQAFRNIAASEPNRFHVINSNNLTIDEMTEEALIAIGQRIIG